jgi:superfamily II DNA or RNA helicase
MRMNEGGLGKVFDCLVESESTEWLISNNFLAPYKYFAPSLVDTGGLKVVRGDYDSTQINMLMEKKYI